MQNDKYSNILKSFEKTFTPLQHSAIESCRL
jgi:hypothetical protein